MRATNECRVAGDPPEVCSGRRERFEGIFDAHLAAVTAYARRRTTPGEADDVISETFLVAWRRLDEVPPEPKPWLLGVARRVLANQRRAAGRRASLEERAVHELTPASESGRGAPILLALAVIPERDRELLLLCAWEGLSPGEVARALGCSRTAAKVRLHRARRRLRTELDRLEREDIGRGSAATHRLEECHEDR